MSNRERGRSRRCRPVRWLALAAALLCAAVIAGCGAGAGASDDSIRIGVVLPLSGRYASAGKSNEQGIRFVVDEVNKSGGIAALDGRKLELEVADDASDPATAAQQARQLISRRQVDFILGPYATPEAQAAAPVARRERVGMLSTQASYDGFFSSGYQYFSTVSMTSSQFGDSYAQFIGQLNDREHAGIKKVAITYPDNDYGQTAGKEAATRLRAQGINVAGVLSFPTDTKDLTPIVQRVRALEPDAVVSIGYLQDGVLLHKARAALGYTKPIWIGGSASFTDERLWGLLGDQTARTTLGGQTYGLAQFDPSARTPGVKWLLGAAPQGEVPDQAVAAGAQAAWILVTALEHARTSDAQQLAAAIPKVKLPANSKRVTLPQFAHGVSFAASGKPAGPVALFVHWNEGKTKVVSPPSLANASIDLD